MSSVKMMFLKCGCFNESFFASEQLRYIRKGTLLIVHTTICLKFPRLGRKKLCKAVLKNVYY